MPAKDQPLRRGRVWLALAGLAGLWALGIAAGVAALLLGAAQARSDLRALVPWLVLGLALLWALLPRPCRSQPPGVKLSRQREPRLWAEVEWAAAALDLPVPQVLWLTPDVNAHVGQAGGWLGVGGRPALGLGLPLLQVLDRSELRAVLAHELGHFASRDRVGSGILRLRRTVERQVAAIEHSWAASRAPLRWLGRRFLAVTEGIARAHELAADAVAARAMGPDAVAQSLRKLWGTGALYAHFLEVEVWPVLELGRRPPIAEGFARFLAAEGIAQGRCAGLAEVLRGEGAAEPGDTHPRLSERLAALGTLPARPAAPQGPAIGLLDDLPELEAALVAYLTGTEDLGALPPVSWERVGEVHVAQWEAHLRKHEVKLPAVRVAELADLMPRLAEIGARLLGQAADPAHCVRCAQWSLGAMLALALVRAGFSITALPGEPVLLRSGAAQLEPFAVVAGLADDSLDEAEWRARCTELGLAELRLPGSP